MSNLEAEDSVKNHLTDVLNQLTEIDPNDLVQESKLGTGLSFEKGLPYFKRALDLYDSLRKAQLDGFPEQKILEFCSYAEHSLEDFKHIQEFSVQGQNEPEKARDHLIEQVINRYDEFHPIIFPVLAYTAQRGADFDEMERRAHDTLKELNSTKDQFETQKDSILKDIENTLGSAREAAAETGVSEHQKHFHDEAKDHKTQAIKWLVATAVLAGATLAYAASFLSIIEVVPENRTVG